MWRGRRRRRVLGRWGGGIVCVIDGDGCCGSGVEWGGFGIRWIVSE